MVDEAGQEQDRGLEDILHSGQRTKDNRTDDWRTSSTQVRGKGYKDRELEDILYSGQRTKDNRTEDWRTSSTPVRGQRITGQRTGGHPLLRSEDKVLKSLIP